MGGKPTDRVMFTNIEKIGIFIKREVIQKKIIHNELRS